MTANRSKVVVVGSLNIDFIASVQKLPISGETVFATGLIQRFGGKGANQAVAAARQGASVRMIGCVGDDEQGRAYCKRLRSEKIDTAGISTTGRALTGTALIAVDHAGENTIVVAAGANGQLKPSSIRAHQRLIASADALLVQQEVPLAAVVESIRIANSGEVPVVLNPSPLRDDFPWGTCKVDTLIANAGEAQSIFRLSLDKISTCFAAWRREMGKRRIERMIITRGARPTIYIDATESVEVPGLVVEPIDTVGAGDAFAGTFTARLAERADVPAAIRHANCAGALATLKAGAQEAIPKRAATERATRHLPRPPSPLLDL